MNYITVLDFEAGRVFQYETMGKSWNPDSESIEDFLISKEHSISNCEYMTTSSGVLRTPESDENKIQNEIFRSR